ncbi:hypothetical protein AB0O34_22550 [Sphaerisporangium sp. NPDC088356]|uniref:hypothetical protein n=1 Tax=Sphaerisporangium sp. NPDC088356 TaxID=3154871 RepID=UPI003446C9C7
MYRLITRLLTRVSLGGALVAGSLLTGSPSHADTAPMVRVVLESFMAYDLEESGHDEIFVMAQRGNKAQRLFPQSDSYLSVAKNDCVSINGGYCPVGSRLRSFRAVNTPSYPADGQLLMVVLWDDDLSGDDALVNVPLWPQPISQNEHHREEADINGYHYVIEFRLEPAWA